MDQSGTQPDRVDKLINFPTAFFSKMQNKAADLNKQLNQQTAKYIASIQSREELIHKRLTKKVERLRAMRARRGSLSAKDSTALASDSAALTRLFDGRASARYNQLLQKLQSDTGSLKHGLNGEYKPYIDSLNASLSFLKANPDLLGKLSLNGSVVGASAQVNELQSKLQHAGDVQSFIRQRKDEIGNYLTTHASLAGDIGKSYQGMNQDLYYYTQQVRQYKEMLNDPDALTQKALSMLNQLPAFQSFMKQNSQLAGLFGMPANYGTPDGVLGLQTRDQVGQMIQQQVAAGGSGGQDALQANLSSAQSQLDGYKDKLDKLGSGSGDVDMPNFKPNDQKTKTFLKRLEYGFNLQTSRNGQFYPNVADLGLSLGYKVSNSSTAGIGISYKLGLGNGWNDIAFSNQGIGLRSFLGVKFRGSWYVSGGAEYNYTMPFGSYRQLPVLNDWTKSGLIGISKVVSLKTKVFKHTKLSLLWDFLSYQQVPRTQAVLFRVGYVL